LWQVSNARARPIKEYFDYDIYYVENQSIFLDITIFILTIFTLLKIRQPTL
jgi:lipopolysaccharide/colanic/teichoic acid biosynthesis glycosyltransferase